MANPIQISNAEWDVMEVVWGADSCTAADVIDRLGDSHAWNHRTVRTLLARLVDKGAITFEADGSRYIYRPAVSRQQCVRNESRSFVNKVFRGDVEALLLHFVSTTNLKPEQVEKLRALLDHNSTRGRKGR